jgi:uncharacterized caspase-like protein
MRWSRATWLVILLLGLMLGELGRGIAVAQPPQEPAPAQGRVWAVLIGAEKYHRANPLRYTLNDVRELAKTLRTRGGVASEQMLELTDDAPNPRLQPLRASLMAELPEFLAKPAPGDRLIVYFSGHGFRDRTGRLFLAPLDCDPADPAATGIAVEWFREQIAACRAGFKLLILDACHAGSEKGEEERPGVAAGDLVRPFDNLASIATLASSTAEEKSQIWEDKQQSLFSYWLNQGLKGHADTDGDGAVDIDELNKYVHRGVTRTAKARFPRPQTPVRIVRSGTPGVPEVVRLRPQGLRQVLSDMAEQLANELEERRLGKVGVLEFTSIAGLDELLGANFGLLGRWCAEELERRLIDQGAGKFSVVDRRRLQSALTDQKFQVRDLGSAEALKQLSGRVGGMPALAQGTLRGRTGRVVTLQCKLVQTDNDELAGSVGGSALLNESDWAMLGNSVAVRPDDRMPEFPEPGQPPRPLGDQVIARLDQRTKGPHPLLDPSFPFPVHFKINGQERQPVFRGNECLLPVKAGEAFQILVENRGDQIVCMRLLVDGLNTLPEPDHVKGVETLVWGKRVNLDEARHYVLDPAQSRIWRVDGFATQTGGDGEVAPFRFAAEENTLAARRRFTEQIGLITAAFYSQAGGARGRIGVGVDAVRKEVLIERAGVDVGNLIAVLHVRLVDADEVGVRVP